MSFSTMALGYFISPFQFNSIQLNFEWFQVFASHHGLGIFYFLYLISLFFSIHFNLMHFHFVVFQNRTFLQTLSILNCFRSKCLFPLWFWVIVRQLGLVPWFISNQYGLKYENIEINCRALFSQWARIEGEVIKAQPKLVFLSILVIDDSIW